MRIRQAKYSGHGWRRHHPCQRVMALVLACALVWVGGLVWVGNAVAVIPDSDPTTFVALEQIDGLDNGGPADHNLYDDDQVPDTLDGLFVLGNGGQDDNREKPFQLRPAFGRNVAAKATAAVSSYHERRTARAYKDFGHLKVMSANDAASNSFAFASLMITPRPPVYYGWPFVFGYSLQRECDDCRGLSIS